VMRTMVEYGIYMLQNPGVMETYIESTTDHREEENNPIEEKLVARAAGILENGDPVKIIMDTFHTLHIGDDDYGRLLMLAIASQHVKNTHGIHLTPSGQSGKGKTHAGQTMLHIVPREYWMESSLSPKSLYYADIKPGTIIFSDDVVIDEELLSIIRRGITNFTSPISHRTIDSERKGTTLTIPERIIWIIASVENFMDEQTRNRMIDIPVDESDATDELVFKKQVEDAKTAQNEFPDSSDVLLCRELFRIIKSLDPVPVAIPFADDIDWKNKSNRRSFDVFKEFIKAYALIRHKQRTINTDGVLEATLEDFKDAKVLYLTKAEGEITKLTKGELRIVRALEDHGECNMQELVRITNIPQTTLRYRLHGRPDRGKAGLLERSKSLIYHHKESIKTDEDTTKAMEVYGVVKKNPLSHYSDVVSLRTDGDTPKHDPPTTTDATPFNEPMVKSAMKDAHDWWFDYTKDSREPYNPDEYLNYLIEKEPKYNTPENREVLRFVLENKKDGAEGWM